MEEISSVESSAPVETAGDSTLETEEEIADTLLEGEEENVSEEQEGEDEDAGEGSEDESENDDSDEEPAEYPVPEGMNPDAWKTVPKGLQEWMTAREHQHAAALAQSQAEIGAANADRDRWLGQAKSQIDDAVQLMHALVEGEFSGIDWQSIGQSDPATAYQLRQAFDKRMAAVQQVKAKVDAIAQQYRQQAAQELDRSMNLELNQVMPSLRAMHGEGFNPATFAREAAAWLSHYGFPKEAINGIRSGREITLVAKAMQYDRIMANRASASRKVKEAPVVNTGSHKISAENGKAEGLRRAKSILGRDNKSTASIAEALLNL